MPEEGGAAGAAAPVPEVEAGAGSALTGVGVGATVTAVRAGAAALENPPPGSCFVATAAGTNGADVGGNNALKAMAGVLPAATAVGAADDAGLLPVAAAAAAAAWA